METKTMRGVGLGCTCTAWGRASTYVYNVCMWIQTYSAFCVGPSLCSHHPHLCERRLISD